ncbi:MAG TPA: hypothetical protein PLT34_06920, partial [Muribaculaceae bacterium]|nr:hypothetical protein [Muribaculaceae bacterium]
ESSARMLDPEVRVFITPQICDMEMLSEGREIFGPYRFEISSLGNTTNSELDNMKARALYRATVEAGADAVIEPLFNSYVVDKDSKTMVIELSGYPVKYSNFRPLKASEIDIIRVVYPNRQASQIIPTFSASEEK